MDIWHVENKNLTRLLLWRTGKHAFQVTQNGDYAPLLSNGNYIVIYKKYAEVFEPLKDQIIVHAVKIVDKEFKIERDDYIELNIFNTIDPSTIATEDSIGFKVWTFGGNIFVSGELKAELSRISDDDFEFNLGFSHFG